ncbi:hypothetical protein GCM10022209_15080 [Chitinophaga oryziterrae]
MRDDEIKLTVRFTTAMIRCLLYTMASVLIYICGGQTRLMWILLITSSVVALYNWICLLRGEVVLLISSDGMKYEGKMMRWNTIVDFETVTYHDSETGNCTYLILKLSNSYLSVNIDISRLNANEEQIREWIKMYTTLPVDKGHHTNPI